MSIRFIENFSNLFSAIINRNSKATCNYVINNDNLWDCWICIFLAPDADVDNERDEAQHDLCYVALSYHTFHHAVPFRRDWTFCIRDERPVYRKVYTVSNFISDGDIFDRRVTNASCTLELTLRREIFLRSRIAYQSSLVWIHAMIKNEMFVYLI